MKPRIYLDYNASAPLCPAARVMVDRIFSVDGCAYNASSVHAFGRDGRKYVEDARRSVANLVGADVSQVIFNSGATEGNNTVLRHFAESFPDDVILVSAIEHPSVMEALGKGIEILPVDGEGRVDLEFLQKRLTQTPRVSLVSVMYANNETGVIQDVVSISRYCQEGGAFFHCDATQALGRVAVDIKTAGIDFLTCSSHKIGGMQGVGALVMRLCGQTPVLLRGGGQEKSARAGTENVAGIASFGAAAFFAKENMAHNVTLRSLRDQMEKDLKAISLEIIVHGQGQKRLPNTSFFSLPGVNAQSLLMALDLEGIAISNGSACSSGSVKPSTVLKAMGKSDEIASSALRISMGWATKENDIQAFLRNWKVIYERIRKNKGS